MKATVDMLFGEKPEMWRIACSATEPNARSKMLKAAARLIKDDADEDVTVGSVHLSGITWDSEDDMFELIVILSLQ